MALKVCNLEQLQGSQINSHMPEPKKDSAVDALRQALSRLALWKIVLPRACAALFAIYCWCRRPGKIVIRMDTLLWNGGQLKDSRAIDCLPLGWKNSVKFLRCMASSCSRAEAGAACDCNGCACLSCTCICNAFRHSAPVRSPDIKLSDRFQIAEAGTSNHIRMPSP